MSIALIVYSCCDYSNDNIIYISDDKKEREKEGEQTSLNYLHHHIFFFLFLSQPIQPVITE